jgi:hypothetical protein
MNALDRAVIAHRDNPTPETRRTLFAAMEHHNAEFQRRLIAEYQQRPH